METQLIGTPKLFIGSDIYKRNGKIRCTANLF